MTGRTVMVTLAGWETNILKANFPYNHQQAEEEYKILVQTYEDLVPKSVGQDCNGFTKVFIQHVCNTSKFSHKLQLLEVVAVGAVPIMPAQLGDAAKQAKVSKEYAHTAIGIGKAGSNPAPLLILDAIQQNFMGMRSETADVVANPVTAPGVRIADWALGKAGVDFLRGQDLVKAGYHPRYEAQAWKTKNVHHYTKVGGITLDTSRSNAGYFTKTNFLNGCTSPIPW
jgi:hypothetical protein